MGMLFSILMSLVGIDSVATSGNFEMLNPDQSRDSMDRQFNENLSEIKRKSVAVEIGSVPEKGKVIIDPGGGGFATAYIDGYSAVFHFKRNEARVDTFIHFNLVLPAPPANFGGFNLRLPTEFSFAGYGEPFALAATVNIFNANPLYNMAVMPVGGASDPYIDVQINGSATVACDNYVRVEISGFFYRKASS